jgi:spore germination protein KB
MERISTGQLTSLIILYLLGTTWLFMPGTEAGRDTWVASLLGMLSGVPLAFLYLTIAGRHPGDPPTEYLPRILGRFLGKLVLLIYALYCLYICSRSLRDLSVLLRTSFLGRTPIFATAIVESLVIGFAVRLGPEVIARVAQLLLPTTFALVALGTLFFVPTMKIAHLKPVLENGLKPAWQVAFPTVTTIPYGELILFLTIFPLVKGRPNRATYAGLLIGGAFLVYLAVVASTVLRPANLHEAIFPLLTLSRAVVITGILQRLDGIVVPLMSFGVFIKASLFLYGAASLLAGILGARWASPLAFPLALLSGAWALTMAEKASEHLYVGFELVPYALHVPLQILLPLLVLAVDLIRRRGEKPPFSPGANVPDAQADEMPGHWSGQKPTPGSLFSPSSLPRPLWIAALGILLVAAITWSVAVWPFWQRYSNLNEAILRPLGKWLGEPFVLLLGGQRMEQR